MIYVYSILAGLFIFVCLFMVLLILIQKGRGGGLSNAFGGGAGGHTAFGTKTGDVLTWATSIVFGLFLLLAVGLNLSANAVHKQATGVAPNAGAADPLYPGSPDSSLPGSPPNTEPAVVPPPGTDFPVAGDSADVPAEITSPEQVPAE